MIRSKSLPRPCSSPPSQSVGAAAAVAFANDSDVALAVDTDAAAVAFHREIGAAAADDGVAVAVALEEFSSGPLLLLRSPHEFLVANCCYSETELRHRCS